MAKKRHVRRRIPKRSLERVFVEEMMRLAKHKDVYVLASLFFARIIRRAKFEKQEKQIASAFEALIKRLGGLTNNLKFDRSELSEFYGALDALECTLHDDTRVMASRSRSHKKRSR